MVLKTTVDATRNWSGTLNRLGFGFLAIFAIVKNPENFDIELSKFDLSTIGSIVLIVFLSMVLGSIVLSTGSFFLRSTPFISEKNSNKFSEFSKVRRAYLVGKTQNPLLAEIFREGTNKFEQASGFIGLGVSIGPIQFIVHTMKYLTAEESGPFISFSGSTPSIWVFVLFLVLVAILAALIWHSASNTITALDDLLEKYSSENEQNINARNSRTGE